MVYLVFPMLVSSSSATPVGWLRVCKYSGHTPTGGGGRGEGSAGRGSGELQGNHAEGWDPLKSWVR